VALLLLLLTPAAARADAYDEALSTARQHAAAGHFKEAARSLEGPAATWPQDLPLQLARAYYLLRAGEYAAAEVQYRRVLDLEPGSDEARRGLEDAQLGRGAPDQTWIGIYGAGTSYSGPSAGSDLYAGVLTVDAQLADRWIVGGLYRLLGPPSSLTSGGGRGRMQGGGTTAEAPLQHELHLSLGLASPGWQVTLRGAAISRSAVTTAGVEQVYGYGGIVAGLSALVRYGLEWRAAVATSWYEDLTVHQLEATAALPLGDHLAFRAGARTQLAEGSTTTAALAGVEWRGPWSLSLAGEYGPQLRPADLEARVLYDVPDRLQWALRLQASIPLSHHARAWLGADLEDWRPQPPSDPPADTTATRLSAGLSFSF
jgi:hypothetical protein